MASESKAATAPSGYHIQSEDVVGYWDSSVSHIHCIPRSARMFDGNIESSKPSILILVELLDDCEGVRVKKERGEDEGELVGGKKGDLVGIWAKAGMRAIRDLAGVKVWMAENGEKDIGKPSPMKLYEIKSPTKGTRIPVTEDTRRDSIGTRTFLDNPKRAPVKGEPDSEEVPF